MDAMFAGYRLVDAAGDAAAPRAAGSGPPVVGPGRIAVLDAVEASSERRVRLVLLPPIDGDLVRRTVVRARTVDHPHLLPDVEVVQDGGRVGVVVPWTDGGTLADLLAVRGTIDPAEVLTVLRPLAGALIAIGDAGLCHGALLPELVFFDADGRPRLAGTGAGLAIAVATGEDRILPVGAPHLAPEVARGTVPDIRADLFALGSLALLAVTGRPAWPAEDVTEVLVQSTAGLWPQADPRVATPELAAIVDGLLAADPSLRPPAAVVQAELRSAGRPRPVDLSPLWPLPDDPESAYGSDDVAFAAEGFEPEPPEVGPSSTGWGPEDHGELPAGVDDRRRTGSRTRRHSAGGGRRSPRAPHRYLRGLGIAVAVAILLGGLAVGGGLWWGAADVPAAGSTVETGAVGATDRATTDAVPTVPVSTVPVSTVPVSTVPVSTLPEPTLPEPTDPVSTDSVSTGSPLPAAPDAGASVDPDSGNAAVSPAVSATVDWLSVVRDIDRRRADALAAADPNLLDTVYVAGPARDADRALVADLQARGLRIDGGAHVIDSAAPVPDVADPIPTPDVAPATTTAVRAAPSTAGGGGDVVLRVERSLPAYPVIDGSGRTVGTTASAGVEVTVLTVRAVGDGFAIVAIGTA